ncbi:MAG: peptide ABC transporter substrate-binding protein [Pyrinomonadaceae bacterium]|nr:peptide ABC transporter substrate-binding protein [Pyrinomonadaceae bacterium]
MKLAVNWFRFIATLAILSPLVACSVSQAGNVEFFGKTEPPKGRILRYTSGAEPGSIDPHIPTNQLEHRIIMALFEGLVEYHPKTMKPIPAIAERWEANKDHSEFVFHLRRNARWSDNDPITADDFVYSFRRAISPQLAARNASFAYYIKYAQSYNEGGVFVRDPATGEFLLEEDFSLDSAKTVAKTEAPVQHKQSDTPSIALPSEASSPSAHCGLQQPRPALYDAENAIAIDTSFHRFIRSPTRFVLPGAEQARAKALESNPGLKAALSGKELVPVKAEDIGVEAVDEYTLRITLTQTAPFFIEMLPLHLFRVVPRKAIEKHGAAWTQPGKIVSCGPFKLQTWKPYNELTVVRDPLYWDAAIVKLDQISFFPLEENMTIMNLYKAGELDAVYNHTVPYGWIDQIRTLKDYMDAPEAAIAYYWINTTKPPMTDKRVRKAFNMAIDKDALAALRRTSKPLTAFTPEGIFPGYPQPKGDKFDPKRASHLLADAGYRDNEGNFDPEKFPTDQVELTYNTNPNNRVIAEFLQAQWKQNLQITVTIKNMENSTFDALRNRLDYKGFARGSYGADYMDPFTFLTLFHTPNNGSGTGWTDPKYDQIIDEANRTLDPRRRYELLAEAEAYLIEEQPMLPLQSERTNWMKKPYVKGLYPTLGAMHAWKFVYIEHDPAKWDRGMPQMTE